MVLCKLFGLIDLFAALLFVLLRFNMGEQVVWYAIGFLLIKSVLFIRNVVSLFDLTSAAFLILAAFNVYTAFTWVAMIWLLQKGFFSLISPS